ncbi:MAG TPA: TetR/AcrR family transcriptional regulator [Caulobacteraceae bacterium]
MGERKTSKRGRPPKEAGGDTSGAILDAAEELFALHGFDGVTLRQVAKAAGVDVALIGYYFGAKRSLFDAVFLRRADILNQERLDALDRYEREAGDAMTLEGLMEAFLRPTMEPSTHRGEGWRYYFALVAQVNNTPVWGGETMTRYFDPVIHRLIGLVHRVMPEAAEEDVYWSYHMLSGALTLSLGQTGRLDLLSGGLCRSDDLRAACDHLVPFAAAGFRAACAERRAGRRPEAPA